MLEPTRFQLRSIFRSQISSEDPFCDFLTALSFSERALGEREDREDRQEKLDQRCTEHFTPTSSHIFISYKFTIYPFVSSGQLRERRPTRTSGREGTCHHAVNEAHFGFVTSESFSVGENLLLTRSHVFVSGSARPSGTNWFPRTKGPSCKSRLRQTHNTVYKPNNNDTSTLKNIKPPKSLRHILL